ncbi:MAG: ABC transporter permease, partial [Lachnospiraceae bacterium]|nr:ABC transporter permease [Lachnospiraceae bacterium]
MNSFANTGKLARFMLRRERIIASVWIIVLLLVVVGLVPAMIEIVGDDNELASMLENPAMIAMIGPAFAVTHDGFGA